MDEPDIEELLARIRRIRAAQRRFKPFTRDWYAALHAEAEVIAELKRVANVTDITAIESLIERR